MTAVDGLADRRTVPGLRHRADHDSMTAPPCGLSAACAAGPTPGPATRRTGVTSDRHTDRQDDAGGTDGHAAGPAGRPGPGRRARRVHPPGAAAPHQPRHRARSTRCSSRAGTPWRRSARRARSGLRSLRAAQCREGWHLEDEPDITPDPASEDQEWWVVLRAEAQQQRDTAAAAGADTTDLDELIAELDEEIAQAGIRGKVNPDRPDAAAPLHPAPPGRPGPAPPQGRPPDGRQDLHRPGRQDVPAVDVRHADLPVPMAGSMRTEHPPTRLPTSMTGPPGMP